MMMMSAPRDIAEEIEAAHAIHKDAEAAYIAALSEIVDVRTMAGGRDGYDFYVSVPAAELHDATQRIVELEYAIRDHYGVHFRTYAIATAV
jgi:hypothetical protein